MKSSFLKPLSVAIAAVSLTYSAGVFAQKGKQAEYFERIATLPVYENLNLSKGDKLEDTTVAEIVAASKDGMTLFYTDSPKQRLGIIDIRDPARPKPAGFVELEGEPTSVAVADHYALVAVNTSESFTNPSGVLVVLDIKNQTSPVRVATLPMGGQPDSVAVSPDGRFAAVIIENERDEDENDGLIPQLPGGYLNIVELVGKPAQWNVRKVDLSGLAAVAPTDPEPEFVTINRANIAAVTLQENNHIALVSLHRGEVIHHFPAGSIDLHGVDTVEDDVINPVDSLLGKRREPDAITWAGPLLATANEGDYEDANGSEGGSRGFSLFSPFGPVAYDSNASLEHAIIRAGHYPESRSENKGVEPEGITFARYDKHDFLFVGAERANLVAVYELDAFRKIRLHQLLPTTIGPEGLLAIPQRNLFVASTEGDSADDGFRAAVSIYRLSADKPFYPQIQSSQKDLIPWGTLSGMTADRWDRKTLFAVPDSYYKQSRIFRIDVKKTPAIIEDAVVLSKDGTTVDYDLEGIAQREDGSFWLASEGDGKAKPNLLILADANGMVQAEYGLPAEVVSLRKSNGFEGVAVIGSGESERVLIAFQREWKNDPAGLVRIGVFNPNDQSWGFFYYPLDATPEGAWVGLSELTAIGGQEFMVIERDNQQGPKATVKKLYRFSIDGLTSAAQGETFPVLSKQLVRDVLPDLKSTNGWVADKIEGTAVTSDGQVFVVSDNDGIDDATGETRFLRLGKILR